MTISPSHLAQKKISIKKMDYSFDFHSERWMLNKDNQHLHSCRMFYLWKPKLLDGFKKHLATYAEEQSAHHTSNMYLRFQRLLRDTKFKKAR